MPSRRPHPEGAAGPTPRRSERLRLQREAAASTAATQAQRVANESTPTNSSTIAAQSRVINAPRRRVQRQRRWRGVDMARIRQAAAEALAAARANAASGNLQTLDNSVRARPLSPVPGDGGNAVASTVHNSSENGTSSYALGEPPGGWTSLVSFTVMTTMPNLLPPPPTGAECNAMMGRLKRELRDFQQDPPEGCTIEIVDDNIFHWRGSILGPPETPYTGGQFHLDLHFGHNYPFSPPKIFFLTKIFHCNVASNGYICLDILSREWSPALTVAKVLLSIRSLMSDPNPDDPLEPNIASMYKRHRTQHDTMASSWTSLYAKPGQEPPAPVYE